MRRFNVKLTLYRFSVSETASDRVSDFLFRRMCVLQVDYANVSIRFSYGSLHTLIPFRQSVKLSRDRAIFFG